DNALGRRREQDTQTGLRGRRDPRRDTSPTPGRLPHILLSQRVGGCARMLETNADAEIPAATSPAAMRCATEPDTHQYRPVLRYYREYLSPRSRRRRRIQCYW